MDSHQRYEALLAIKSELEQWLAFYPEHRVRIHGSMRQANQAYQLCKQLISHEAMTLLAEESQKMGLYYEEGDVNSLGLHNIE